MSNKDFLNNIEEYLTILGLIMTPGVGPARLRNLFNFAKDKNINPSELIKSKDLPPKLLNNEQINQFNSTASNANKVLNELHKFDISLLTMSNDNYPRKLKTLGDKAPPYLFAMGNLEVLFKKGVGFCGARKASQKGLEAAYDCALQISNNNYNIVSGYASGVDVSAHKAALESGGTTTIVLVDGILHFNIRKDLKNIWDWDRVVVVSEFPPNITWKSHNAMQRNKTICGLSDAVIIVEAASKGGSIAAARTCLKMGLPLFSPVYDGNPETANGNSEMLKKGAVPIYKSRTTMKANLTKLFDLLISKESLPIQKVSPNGQYSMW